LVERISRPIKRHKSHTPRVPDARFRAPARVRTRCVPFSDDPQSVGEPRMGPHSEPAQVPQTYVSTYGTPRPPDPPALPPPFPTAIARRSGARADRSVARASPPTRDPVAPINHVGRSRLDPIATSARRGRTRRGGSANAPLSPAMFATVPSTLLLRILTFALPSAPPPRSFSHHVRCLLCWRPDG
jgi:hypothetical protein